uniref:Serine protease 27-like n=2 Tax=Poecilia formosa TaxID=48698 RepID=A0A096LPZ4_POEFO
MSLWVELNKKILVFNAENQRKEILVTMALQGFAWGITVMIALFFKGGDSQPACARTPINSRIIGGQDASPGSWPWHVALTSNGYNTFCQGSLITDEWVLTAAQCSTSYYLSGAVLHFGATNLSGLGEVTRRVDHFVCHQDYTYNKENDICLVKLSAPVNFTDYIRPVCLAAENSTFYDGTSSWVTGFSNFGYYYPNTLQEVDVSVFGNTKCSCLYRTYYYYYYYYYYGRSITDNMMCAGSENGSKNAYYGDGGAALVTKKDSIWVQSGIVSYVYDNYLGRPSVYTRVSQYHKWITDRVTGMKPGFVTYTSPGNDSDFNYTCPPPPSPTPYPTWYHNISTWYPYTTTDGSIFGSGETLIPITRVFPLSALVLFLHLFVGGAGN